MSNINTIIKLRNAFLKLSLSKVLEIYNIISNSNQRSKPKVNMTTKRLSRKQIIIPISSNNMDRVIGQSNIYVLNINYLLKGIKSEICTDFICSNNRRIIITTNKVVSALDINTIKILNEVMSPRLL